MTQALINPALMIWSRRRAGLSAAELAQSMIVKEDKVRAWEAGEARPTFRQAQQWADRLHIPFGFLFLKEPPKEVLPLPDLRTVGSAPLQPPSVDLLDTVRDVLRKQEWYLDYLAEQERAELPFVGRFSIASPVARVVADIRAVLDAPDGPLGSEQYMRALINGADAAGILVMRSGIVGCNTHRKLDIGEFRGFAISDKFAPVVFINSADAPSARLFTLLHELAHIWIGSSGISDAAVISHRRQEAFCNAVAGEFLVPEAQFKALWSETVDWRSLLPELAAVFHVSRWVIARRACDLGFLSRQNYSDFYVAELNAFRARKNGGGSFYSAADAKNSKRFSRAVLSEALSGRMLLREAGKLLGVQPAKVRTYAEKIDE